MCYKLMGDVEKNRAGNEEDGRDGFAVFNLGRSPLRCQCLNEGLGSKEANPVDGEKRRKY